MSNHNMQEKQLFPLQQTIIFHFAYAGIFFWLIINLESDSQVQI